MMIQNCDHAYEVIQCLGSTEDTVEYLCRESGHPGEGFFLLVCVGEPVLAKNFTLFLEEKVRKDVFTDYRECFQWEQKLYAVFAYSVQQTLTERLDGELMSLLERVQIAHGLFKRLLLQDPPPYFAVNALRPEQVTVSRSLDVGWNYRLRKVRQFDAAGSRDAARGLLEVLELLFAPELKRKLYPELEGYLDALDEGRLWPYVEMYRAFLPVGEVLLNDSSRERVPQTFWFRLWERIKKLLGFLRRVLMAALIAAAVLYVVFVLTDNSGSGAGQQVFNQIGDLVIEQETE